MVKFSSFELLVGLLLLGCESGDGASPGSEVRDIEQHVALESKAATTEPRTSAHRLLLVAVEQRTAVITGERIVDSPLKQSARRIGYKAWSFDALDGQGSVIHQDNLPEPGLVRGEFQNPALGADSPPDHVEAKLAGPHHIQIRVPMQTRAVKFYSGMSNHRHGPELITLGLEGQVQP